MTSYGQPPQNPYGYPPQSPYGQPQQPAYGQPQQPVYGQPQQPAYGQPAGYPPQGAPAPQAQQAPTTSWNMPDEATVEAGYQRAAEIAAEAAKARAGGGGDMKFVRMPGPQGQPKWDATVPVGWESRVAIYLAPAWAPGTNYYIEGITHFWKSYQHPNGTSIGCPGKDICLIDKSRGSLFNSGREEDAKRARMTLRPQKHFYYQGFLLDLGPHQHVGSNGALRPFILDAGSDLHAKIQFIMKNRGFQNVIHPDGGRPLIIVKKKTGVEVQNVDWDAIDGNPMPLPQEYRQAQLWDLSKLVTAATAQEQIAALQECGMPIPPEAHGMMQPGMAPPPAQSYGQPAYGGNPGWQPAPGQPPFPSPYQQPGYGQPAQAMPPSFGAQPQQPPQQYPVPPQTSLPFQQPSVNAAVPAMGAPPPPPPVVVPPAGAAPSGYQPQPSQAGGYAAPPPMGPPPSMAPPPMGPPPMGAPGAGGPPSMPPPPTMAPPSRPQ